MNFVFALLLNCVGAGFITVAAQSAAVSDISTDKLKEADFEFITKFNVLKIGETVIQIAVSDTKNPRPVYFRPHENEQTASQAVAATLKKYGGAFVEIKSRGERLVKFKIGKDFYTFDPNRIFSAVGTAASLKNYGKSSPEAEKAVGDFVETLLKDYLFKNKDSLIVAVHNNTDAGGLSIKTLELEPKTETADVYINSERDIDDFFYVTTRRDFEFFKAKNFNVVLQNNETVTDDGSLSVYCGKKNVRYINIETEHGHLAEQIEMLEILQKLLAEKIIEKTSEKDDEIKHSEPKNPHPAPKF